MRAAQTTRAVCLTLLAPLLPLAAGVVVVNETSAYVALANKRLAVSVNKRSGAIDVLALDGQDLLGSRSSVATVPANTTGRGPYLDCYCVPSGAYTPGSKNATYNVFRGVDAGNLTYAGVGMSEVYPPTGQLLEQYWFLRDGETGLHTFSRVAYYNSTTPFLRNLQELRTLFRPKTNLWTHLITNEEVWAPLPLPNPAVGNTTDAATVQDATWYLGNRTGDPYVEHFADYFTKYTFSATWRNHSAHGMFADGTNSNDGSVFGAWLVQNTKDTYFGGPLHSDLAVDGIVYNYIVSNHHGASTPNITDGFDRTFGPQYFHFNRAPAGTPWQQLLAEAAALASPRWNVAFYDTIASHVPNYVPSSGRGRWEATIALPPGAARAVAVLALDGVDFQDNARGPSAYQYWAEVDAGSGHVAVDGVRAGTYRLTVYADNVFGDFVRDGVMVRAGVTSVEVEPIVWMPEAAGKELWRIGTPDKAAGEWRHGVARDPAHPLHPPEYRIYWGKYDFIQDFPEGVKFHVGRSKEAEDFNYVHWSVFGGHANSGAPVQRLGRGEINNWTITFDLSDSDMAQTSDATFTVQLAAAKTAAGNTHSSNASQAYNNVPFVVVVNGRELPPWVIPYYQSSSCAVRSGISCYQLSNKFVFPVSYLTTGNATNEIVLSLPNHAMDFETALLPGSVYVQYDALRLEVK